MKLNDQLLCSLRNFTIEKLNGQKKKSYQSNKADMSFVKSYKI